jgi:glycosyltransferase involved in cell wall biosynthesis
MNKPLFSIVVPSLNSGVFLERALVSIIHQAGDDTEIIVVDGGSTDGSVEILRKYAKDSSKFLKFESSKVGEGVLTTKNTESTKNIEHSTSNIEHRKNNFKPAFYWSSEKDRGQSHALNKGFAKARGEYLFWVNADDLLLPGTLDRIRAYLSKNPGCEWLAGNLIYIDQQDKVLWCARDGQWHDWLYRHAPVRVYGPSSIFTKRLFDRVGGFDESLHYVMDTDLWLRFKKAGARFVRLPYYFWGFRVHEGSKTSGDLMGKKPADMAAEQTRMYAKNGLKVTQFGLWSQRLWRVVNGCYARAWWDTRARAKRTPRQGGAVPKLNPPPGRGSP